MYKNIISHKGIKFSECPQNFFYSAKTPVRTDNLFIAINRCGFTEKTPRVFYVKRDDSYPYNVIHFCTNGQGTLTTVQHTKPIKAGSIFITSAHEPHQYDGNPDDPMSLLWLEYTGGDSDRLTNQIASMISHAFSPENFLELYHHCCDIIMHTSYGESQLSLSIYSLLVALYAQCTTLPSNEDMVHQSVLAYIEEHIGDDLSLSIISAAFNYNPSYFSTRFRRFSGISYLKYIQKRRISQACNMLSITTWSIEQIGQLLGFYDASHFIRTFENIMKLSPAKYRMRMTSSSTPPRKIL